MYLLVYLEVWPANVSADSPGNMTGQCICWFTCKYDRPLYLMVYLKVWPANVSAGLPGSMTSQCICWFTWSMTSQCICCFTWKYDRPMYLLVNVDEEGKLSLQNNRTNVHCPIQSNTLILNFFKIISEI